jgi:hypothetical protein
MDSFERTILIMLATYVGVVVLVAGALSLVVLKCCGVL